ncbi:MAG TPA: carboxypeptidase-like regulatory domain-containing protein, partial [Planctomycetota bacterium]
MLPARLAWRRVFALMACTAAGIGPLTAQESETWLTGSLRQPDETPVVGIALRLVPAGEGGGARSARTGAQGVFRFEDLAPGAYRLAYGPDDEPLGPAFALEVLEGANRAELRTVRLGSLRVRIAAADGRAAAGMEVLASERPGRSFRAMAGVNGVAVFPFLPAGFYRVHPAELPGLQARCGVFPGEPTELGMSLPVLAPAGAVPEAGSGSALLPPETGHSELGGVLRDGAGRPLADVEVRLRREGRADPIARTRSGPDGRFAFPELPSGRWFFEYGPLPPESLAERASVAVVAPARGSAALVLFLHQPDGTAVAGLQVRLRRGTDREIYVAGGTDG